MTHESSRPSSRAPMTNAPSGTQPLGLAPSPLATPQRTIHMIGNSHIDPVWLWPWQEGYQEAWATFRSVLDRMDEYPDFRYTCDQMILLAWVEEQDPDMFERIRQRVQEGRWVNTGGWWVEPDCNMPTGEAFARQGLLGQRYLISRFGKPATVGMNADPFGHNRMIPQILRLQGMDSYTFLRPGPHESDFADTLFWWEAPDGSRVLASRIPFEYCSPPGSVAGQTEKALGQLDKRFHNVQVFYGVGNHGGGPTKANIDSIHRFNTMGSFGHMMLSDARTYFDAVRDELGDEGLAKLPVRRDDLQHHAAGCYSAHSGIKMWQRRAQSAVLVAERWASIVAQTTSIRYPYDDLTRAWKQIAFNQFHDILPGSAIEPSYDDARDQLGEAVSIAKRITTHAHNLIAHQIDIPMDTTTQPVVVFNPHPWPVETDVEMQYGGHRSGVHVVDADGNHVLSQRTQSFSTTDDPGRGAVVFRANVPPLGYRLYRIGDGAVNPSNTWSNGKEPGRVHATPTLLENDVLRVEFDSQTGWITSLLNKRTGVDVMAGAVGEHTQVSEDPTDTWGHRVVSYAGLGAPMKLRRMLVRETGELRAVLRVEREWGSSEMIEEFMLGADADALLVNVTIDWHEKAHLMKLRFPTAIDEPVGTYEIPYGFQERAVDGAEQPGQSWIDLTGIVNGIPAGLTVINNAKHGYDLSPRDCPTVGLTASLGITAVRSAVYSWHDPQTLEPDGIYSYQDQGIQRFSYELVPHGGDWRESEPMRRAQELVTRVRAQQETFHPGPAPAQASFISLEPLDGDGQINITAIKGAEDAADSDHDDLIIRFVEQFGRATSVRCILPFMSDRSFTVDCGPCAIRTFRVPVDPEQPIVEVDLVERPLATVS